MKFMMVCTVKVKISLEQAMKAQGRSSGIALLSVTSALIGGG
jgi:hypothetical protein